MPCLKSRALFISHFQVEVEVEEDATCSAFPELQTKPLQTLMEIHLQGKTNNKDYDLFGNKKQICGQKLKGGNLALKNNIKKSIPVRVIRGHKSRNSYCGKVYTYDGLYKVAIKNPVVDYQKETGDSGFIVFKYV